MYKFLSIYMFWKEANYLHLVVSPTFYFLFFY